MNKKENKEQKFDVLVDRTNELSKNVEFLAFIEQAESGQLSFAEVFRTVGELKQNPEYAERLNEYERFCDEMDLLDTHFFVPVNFEIVEKMEGQPSKEYTEQDHKNFEAKLKEHCKQTGKNYDDLTVEEIHSVFMALDPIWTTELQHKYRAINLVIIWRLYKLTKAQEAPRRVLKYFTDEQTMAIYGTGILKKEDVKFNPSPDGEFINYGQLPFVAKSFKKQRQELLENCIKPNAFAKTPTV